MLGGLVWWNTATHHPLVHDFVVGPAVVQFFQQVLVVLVAKRRQDGGAKIVLDGVAMALVELLGPVVRLALRAHVVACGVNGHECAGRERLIRLVYARIEDLLEHVDGFRFDLIVPALLQPNHLRGLRHALLTRL